MPSRTREGAKLWYKEQDQDTPQRHRKVVLFARLDHMQLSMQQGDLSKRCHSTGEGGVDVDGMDISC